MTKTRVANTEGNIAGSKNIGDQNNPEYGPKILFFSGGSAINGLSSSLQQFSHNSIHLMTPFDSGGSSAELRKAFSMPAIGDTRSRLVALSNKSIRGNKSVCQLFNYRLDENQTQAELHAVLESMICAKSPLLTSIVEPMKQLICDNLAFFIDVMPVDFHLQGACIGNLILTAAYLNHARNLDPVIELFSKYLNVQGIVQTIVDQDLHLVATLEDGRRIVGQHRLTGKEVVPLTSPIVELFISSSLDEYRPAQAILKNHSRQLIEDADLICYPPGSFYSSLIANLIPKGVSEAIARNNCPKVYIPNLGYDPEQLGMSLEKTVKTLLKQLKKDTVQIEDNTQFLNYVLLDKQKHKYPPNISDILLKQGIRVVEANLVSHSSAPYYDDNLLSAALMSLI